MCECSLYYKITTCPAMLCRLFTQMRHPLHLRSLSQLFLDSSPPAQSSPLPLFFRSPSLLSFQSSLTHIYTNTPSNPALLSFLPPLLSHIATLPPHLSSPYLKLFSLKTLPQLSPSTHSTPLKHLYISHLSTYLSLPLPHSPLSLNDIYHIHNNLLTLLQTNQKSDIFNRYTTQQTLRSVFSHLLHKLTTTYLPLFQNNVKYSIMLLSKSLRVYDEEFTQHMKYLLVHEYRQFSTLQVLTILSYLSDTRAFPGAFFYQMKQEWLKVIAPQQQQPSRKLPPFPSSSDDTTTTANFILLDKNTACLLKLLEVLSKQRLEYYGEVLERVYGLVMENVEDLDGVDLVRVLYYYSKGRWRDEDVEREIAGRVGKKMEELEVGEMGLLLIALGRLGAGTGREGVMEEITKNQHFMEALDGYLGEEDEGEAAGVDKEYFRNLRDVLIDTTKPQNQ